MSTNPAVISDGHAAAERCRPYMDKARISFLDACKKIGKEYAALPDGEKKVFRTDLNLSEFSIKSYSAIAEHGDEKLKIIAGVAAATPCVPPSVRVWREIAKMDDDTLRTAAKAGLFTEYEVTNESINHFKKTGQLPAIKKKEKKTATPLQKIKAEFQRAEKATRTAAGCIGQIHYLMDEHNVSDIRGPEVGGFRKELENLIAAVAAADPALMEKAVKIWRGEE